MESNTKPNNPPAFPLIKTHWQNSNYFDVYSSGGMTLRDYFAAMAMAHIPFMLERSDDNLSYSNISEHCYKLADAMLAEREKEAK